MNCFLVFELQTLMAVIASQINIPDASLVGQGTSRAIAISIAGHQN